MATSAIIGLAMVSVALHIHWNTQSSGPTAAPNDTRSINIYLLGELQNTSICLPFVSVNIKNYYERNSRLVAWNAELSRWEYSFGGNLIMYGLTTTQYPWQTEWTLEQPSIWNSGSIPATDYVAGDPPIPGLGCPV
jgi:hypothetical protein